MELYAVCEHLNMAFLAYVYSFLWFHVVNTLITKHKGKHVQIIL